MAEKFPHELEALPGELQARSSYAIHGYEEIQLPTGPLGSRACKTPKLSIGNSLP